MPIDLDPLARCQPLQGPQHRLPTVDITDWLASHCPQWQLAGSGQSITRTFTFPDYYHTMSFVNALAHVAHHQNHHPDLAVHYDRVVVSFSTHDVGGVSLNDLRCALQADALSE